MSDLLYLPRRKLTGCSDDVYTTEEADWDNKTPKTSDLDELPIAWTPHQQQLYDDDAIPFFMPKVWYGSPSSIGRLPRVVVSDLKGIIYDKDVNYNDVYGPILSRLEKAQVAVLEAKTAYEGATRVAYRMFLPHEEEEEIEDTSVRFGTVTNNFPKVTANNWIAGEVLYVDVISTLTFDIGPYCDMDDQLFGKHDNIIEKHVNQIKACKSKYRKFGYHLAFPNPNDGRPIRPLIKAMMEDIVNNKLANHNCTLHYLDQFWNASKPAIYERIRTEVLKFFNIP